MQNYTVKNLSQNQFRLIQDSPSICPKSLGLKIKESRKKCCIFFQCINRRINNLYKFIVNKKSVALSLSFRQIFLLFFVTFYFFANILLCEILLLYLWRYMHFFFLFFFHFFSFVILSGMAETIYKNFVIFNTFFGFWIKYIE